MGYGTAMHSIDKQREPAVAKAGRPRDPAIDDEVRAAARVLLAEGGYRALTFDSISQRTGIPRSMIYRRWPSKAHLANDIAVGGEANFPDIIEAEGLTAQIGALVTQIHARYQVPAIAAASIGVIADTQGDHALQEALRGRPEAELRIALADIVARGQVLGLIRAGVDADVLFDMIVGGLVYRALFSLKAEPQDYVARFSQQILASIAG